MSAMVGFVKVSVGVPCPEKIPPFVTATLAFLQEYISPVPVVATVIICIPFALQVVAGVAGWVVIATPEQLLLILPEVAVK